MKDEPRWQPELRGELRVPEGFLEEMAQGWIILQVSFA